MKVTIKLSSAIVLASLLTIVVACGEATEPSATDAPGANSTTQAEPGFGEVAFTTYQTRDGFRLAFLSPSKVRKSWNNMGGDPVIGQYAQVGKQITVTWDQAATHHGSLSEKLMQTGPCSLTRYERVDRENQVHDDQPQVYQQKEPICDAVRVVN
jgi:hypothetical protein